MHSVFLFFSFAIVSVIVPRAKENHNWTSKYARLTLLVNTTTSDGSFAHCQLACSCMKFHLVGLIPFQNSGNQPFVCSSAFWKHGKFLGNTTTSNDSFAHCQLACSCIKIPWVGLALLQNSCNQPLVFSLR